MSYFEAAEAMVKIGCNLTEKKIKKIDIKEKHFYMICYKLS